uniref:Uncharacterized protein n=1 Tax=Romanomermis culicivorax TaxID=13658 RepID=A0A915KDW9_ROMCU
MADGNLQHNRTEQKFPFCSVTLCRLHSVPFRRKKQQCIMSTIYYYLLPCTTIFLPMEKA